MENIVITEDMLQRFLQLTKKAKEIDKELSHLKKVFNQFFDHKIGKNEKGEWEVGNFRLQRQIRVKENLLEEQVVQKLEELNLTDCILYVKKPDPKKIEAAVTLGLLSEKALEEFTERKFTAAILVKEK
jgi:hypothetical protein